jgi:hypothetical protein
MKLILLTIIFPLLIISYFAQENESKNFSDAKLELTITDIKKNPSALEIEITLKNKGSNSILTVVPKIEDSFKTSYFLGLDERNKILQIRRHLFVYPPSILDAPVPCYTLHVLEKDKNYSEKFSLSYPLAMNSYLGMNVDISKYSKFNAQIGVLPFDSDIYQIPNKRPFGHCVMPEDEIEDGIYKGKTLLEVQRILTADSK